MKNQTTRRPVNVPEEPAMNRTTFSRLALAALLLGALVVPGSLATTLTFRQGANGYTGARDTMLQQAQPNLNNGTAVTIGWDSDDPNGTGQDIYSLLRFDSIFGGGAGQVPLGSQITEATLTYYVTDVGDAAELRLPLVAWEDTATYTSFCGGNGCNEGEEFGPSTGSAPAAATGAVQVDVTAVVQGWSDGQANRGWFIYPTGSGGVDISSSDHGTTTNRPLLTIRYNEGPPTSDLVREPYLQLVTSDSITVVWRTTTSTASVVEYGTVFGSYPFSASAASGVDHYVPIDSLAPATKYFYRLGTGGSQGGGTTEHYFVTSPTTGTAQPFRFWVFGDSGICSPIQTTILNSMLAYTAANGPAPDLFLHTGDVAQSSGADSEYTDCHLAYYETVLRHTPFWPAMGNHDSYSTSCSGTPLSCTGPYFSTFVLPAAAQAGGYASGTEAYYSWDYGNTHFIVLDGVHNRSATGPMALWLQQDLASPSATNAQWIVAYWHQPPYTKGTHDSDTEIECREMRENIVPILEAGGVDLVLNGHSHGYERSYLIDGTYTTPTPTFSTLVSQGHILDTGPGTPADPYSKPAGIVPHQGTVYSVVASGGQPPGGAHNHPVMYYSESANGSALVDIDADSLTLTFLRSDGSVRDKLVIEKGPQAPRVSQTNPPKSSVTSSLPSITVTFSTDVTGVDAGDLTVNGSPATTLQQNSAREYVFSGYAAPAEGLVDVVLAQGGISELNGSGLPFAGDAWSYTLDTSPPVVISEIPARGTSIGTLASVTVTFSKPVFNVTPDDLAVNGSPAATVSGNDGTPGPFIFSGFAKPDDGIVTVVLSADGIVDDQLPPKPFAGDTWTYELTRRLIINEFLASNNTAAQDENGEYDDYLEIYNPTREPVDMSGMFLTDDLDSPALYRIPDGVVVPALGYIVFWCDSQPAQGPTHTNFNILRAGEDLGLYDTEANGLAPIDTLTFTTQTTDIASGRFPDGTEGFVQMPVTPGAPNTISCTQASECAALTTVCATGVCSGNRCVAQAANEGGACDDGIACTVGDVCVAGICNNGTENCPPGQECNRATGICEEFAIDPLPILGGEEWRYFKGTAEPTPADLTAWAQVDFDDSGWLSGLSGFGFGPDCTTSRGTTLDDMSGSYLGIYTRKLFQVDNPARVTSLTLTVDFDDAYLVYLNGVEVARSATMGGTVGVPPPYDHALVSGTNHECSACDTAGSCNAAAVIDLTSSIGLLQAGNNVIAVRGHNVSLTSSDFTILATLSSTEIAGCDFNSDCDDSNPCTDDVCDAGVCSNTNDDSNFCTDTNPCTDDACSAGVCNSTPDNTNTCSDGVACTTDACVSGTCVPTDACTPPQSCNHATGVCETATSPVTVTFQQGVGGYGGTADTYIDAALGSQATVTPIVVDGSPVEQVLVRFDGIFGSGAGQIPPGAIITSATLTLRVGSGANDQSANPVNFHRLLHPWADTGVWADYGVPPWNGTAGIQADNVDAVSTIEATATMSTASTAYPVSVLASLQAWSADPSSNYGWVILPTGTDGLRLESSESATASYRPLLTVTYTQSGCTSDLDCDDDNPCTDDTCDLGTGICDHANDDGNFCTDGVACTADACSAGACVSSDSCTGGQVCNYTTGLCETPPPIDPLPILAGESWSYFKGTAEPTPGDLTAWTRLTYDDSAWLAGPSGFGYGTDCAASRGTTLSDMQNPPSSPGYMSLYLRKEFWVANPAQVLTLTMTADYDDAFVVYINGSEVARRNVTGTPPAYNQVATADHECSVCGGTCNPPEDIDLTAYTNLLVAGTNVIAIQAHNLTLNSSDFTILPTLSSTETSGCTSDPECNNGLYCDGVETCNTGTGVCQNGTPPDCSDGVACTIDSCDEGTDSCQHVASDPACDDSDLCTIDDCDPILDCQTTLVDCDDGVACTDDDCDPGTGCTHADNCTGGLVCNLTSGACESSSLPVTVTFQDGVAAYTGTVDTYVHAGSPDANNSAATTLIVDGPGGSGTPADERQILIRFEQLFQSEGGSIPDGATIQSATLTVYITNASVDGAQFHRMIIPWTDTATWNSLGNGVQQDGVESIATADVTSFLNSAGTFHNIDVTSSLAAWSAGQTNRGWVLISPPAGTSDSWQFTSSEGGTVAQRPLLTVTYQAACTSDLDCDDDNPCTDDSCNLGTGICSNTNNDLNACTDGVACTTDACSAGECVSTDACTGGEVCNHVTGLCETPPPIDPLPILAGESWNYFKGTAEPTPGDLTAWTRLTYDDSGWLAGPSGFGYGTDCATGHGTVLSDMQNAYVSVYMRKPFWVVNPAQVATLTMTADYDDAFVVYINGTEVARRNVTGTPPAYTQLATVDHECSSCNSTCNPVEEIDLTAFRNLLVAGTNVIAIQAHNLTSGSTDFTILPTLASTETSGCTSDPDCNNNLFCDGAETCNTGTGFCEAGTPPDCDDGVACTVDSCDEGADTCAHQANDAACEDGNLCTLNSCDLVLGCQSSAVSCDDGVTCTDDACDPGTGCSNVDNCTGGQVCNLTSGVCETSTTPVTVTFQDGFGSYTGTHDTLIHQASPAVNYGADETWGWDLEDPAPNAMTGLIRFAGIFGSGAGQIPPGSTIQSATLTITVFDPSVTPGANVNEVAVDWDEGTVTYDNFGGDPGVQADEYGALVGTGPIANGAFNLDVTSSLTAWSADPSANRGWIFRPASINGIDVRSSEYLATPAERPILSVTFVPPATGPTARMSCELGAATASPNGSVDLDILLENLGGMPGVRGYQTQLEIVRTSGTGTLAVSCPGGVTIDDARTDFLFYGLEHFPATNCGLARASSSLREGSVVVDGTPDYLSDYLLAVSADATLGSTFEIRISTTPDSDLADENSDPIPFETGPACVLTISGCGSADDCDDGNPCTDDTCDAGTCVHTDNTDPCDDGNLCTTGDVCGAGTCAGAPVTCNDSNACTTDSCDPGTGACLFDPITCNDGSVCTTDSCDPGLGCQFAPISCDDGDACTADTCDAVLGCQYAPSGSCGVTGTVRYYRDGTLGEPSTKPTPSVAIDVDEDAVSEDVTDTVGLYGVGSLAGRVAVATLPKWGTPRASDHNGAVTSYDATLIARHVVGTTLLSTNQQLAGDASGNGSLSSYDASLVAQFAVELIPHLPVATSTGSDWRFFRCDHYVSASNHDCTDPSFLHDPLSGTPTDDFYSLLFGDVSGNWQASGSGFAAARPTDAEAAFRAADSAEGARLRASGYRLPAARPGGATLTLDAAALVGASAGQRLRVPLTIENADGIQALDLALTYDASAIEVVGVERGSLADRLSLADGRAPGRLHVALYGVEALAGSGEVLILTIEVGNTRPRTTSLGIDALANEGAIPIQIQGLRADPGLRLPAKLLPRSEVPGRQR